MAESFTNHYNLSKFDQGDNPGSAKLNANWDTIDEQIFSSSLTVLTATAPISTSGNNVSLNYNTTNLRVTNGQLNTVQNLSTGSGPHFGAIIIGATPFSSGAERLRVTPGVPAEMFATNVLISGSHINLGNDSLDDIPSTDQTFKVGINSSNSTRKALIAHGNTVLTSSYGTFVSTPLHQFWGNELHVGGTSTWHSKNYFAGDTFHSGSAYFSGSVYMNKRIILDHTITHYTSSTPGVNKTASEDDVTSIQSIVQSRIDNNIVPSEDLQLYVSGSSRFRGDVNVTGSLILNGVELGGGGTGSFNYLKVNTSASFFTDNSFNVYNQRQAGSHDITILRQGVTSNNPWVQMLITSASTYREFRIENKNSSYISLFGGSTETLNSIQISGSKLSLQDDDVVIKTGSLVVNQTGAGTDRGIKIVSESNVWQNFVGTTKAFGFGYNGSTKFIMDSNGGFQALGGYSSSDGTVGLTATVSATSSLVIKNGLVVGVV